MATSSTWFSRLSSPGLNAGASPPAAAGSRSARPAEQPGRSTTRARFLPHLVSILSLVLAASGTAAAQSPAYRAELFAGAGASRVGGDEGSLGTGPSLVAGAGLRIWGSVSVEVDLSRAWHARRIAGGPLEGTGTALLGSLLRHFGDGPVQPFVMGGVGVLTSRTTHTYQSGTTATVARSDDTRFAWGGGAGLRIFLADEVSLRPQVRVVFSDTTGVMGLLATSVALGYHW